MANNETGVLQPVAEIGKIAAEADVYFHTDAVQAAGKVPLNVHEIGCDLLTISAHKIHGPQGTGALFVRKGTLLQPMLYGGRHERSRRAGTENLPGIVGLGKAAEVATRGFTDGTVAQMSTFRDRLERSILDGIEQVAVNGGGAPRVPNTTNISFDCIEGEAMVIALDLSADRARGSIRFSIGKQSTADDVEFALRLVPEAVARLREISPVYKKVASN
jgi:cysteine desulfurase